MKRFNITSFDVLDDAPLGEIAQGLRDVEGSGWKEIEDPTTRACATLHCLSWSCLAPSQGSDVARNSTLHSPQGRHDRAS